MHFVSRPVQTMKPEALNPLMRTQALAQPQRSSHLPRAAGCLDESRCRGILKGAIKR